MFPALPVLRYDTVVPLPVGKSEGIHSELERLEVPRRVALVLLLVVLVVLLRVTVQTPRERFQPTVPLQLTPSAQHPEVGGHSVTFW